MVCSTFTRGAKPATRRVADGERMNPQERVARTRKMQETTSTRAMRTWRTLPHTQGCRQSALLGCSFFALEGIGRKPEMNKTIVFLLCCSSSQLSSFGESADSPGTSLLILSRSPPGRPPEVLLSVPDTKREKCQMPRQPPLERPIPMSPN